MPSVRGNLKMRALRCTIKSIAAQKFQSTYSTLLIYFTVPRQEKVYLRYLFSQFDGLKELEITSWKIQIKNKLRISLRK